MPMTRLVALLLLIASPALAQPLDPFPTPIPATDGVVRVDFIEFATLPDVGGEAARMMLLVDEPGTRRLFVNDMRGPLYTRRLRRQDGRRRTSISTRPRGASASSRAATSAASRASRFTRSSAARARPASAGSTR